MPSAPLRHCVEPGCPNKVASGRCAEHHAALRAHHRRFTKGQPGVNYGRRWTRERNRYLAEHPDCAEPGCTMLADELDHIIPHRGDAVLFWAESNWQGLCREHHARKTAIEVGLGGAR